LSDDSGEGVTVVDVDLPTLMKLMDRFADYKSLIYRTIDTVTHFLKFAKYIAKDYEELVNNTENEDIKRILNDLKRGFLNGLVRATEQPFKVYMSETVPEFFKQLTSITVDTMMEKVFTRE